MNLVTQNNTLTIDFYFLCSEDEKSISRVTKDIPCSPFSKREDFHPQYSPPALGNLHLNQTSNIQLREEDSGVDSIITNNSESIGSGSSSSASQSKTPFQSNTSLQSKQQKPTLPVRSTPVKQSAVHQKPFRPEVNKGNKEAQHCLHEMSSEFPSFIYIKLYVCLSVNL